MPYRLLIDTFRGLLLTQQPGGWFTSGAPGFDLSAAWPYGPRGGYPV